MKLRIRSRWHRWFIQPLIEQLTRGVTPRQLGWTIALAVVLGVFPIMGTTSLLCLLVGWVMRLNQPVLHAFNTLMYPAHLALILVFIRLGERLCGSPPIIFSIPELLSRFKTSPLQFSRDFGVAALQGVGAWLLIAPFAVFLIKLAITPLLVRFARKIEAARHIAA